MLFDNFLAGLTEQPNYHRFVYHDDNPLGGYQKCRIIYDPNEPLRQIQRRLMEAVRFWSPAMPIATACKPGDSPIKNVQRHAGNRYFFVTDIHDAYGSVKTSVLLDIIEKFHRSLADDRLGLRRFLEQFCLAEKGGLATGALCSPDLFNLYAAEVLDRLLIGFCVGPRRLKVTRYLDDITISSSSPIGKQKRRMICHLIRRAGFEINNKKTHVWDLAKNPVTINGVGLDQTGRIFLPRGYHRRIDQLLDQANNGRLDLYFRICGMMGVFKTMTPAYHAANATERRLYEKWAPLYRLYWNKPLIA